MVANLANPGNFSRAINPLVSQPGIVGLVYAYSVGVCSSRKIAAACQRNLAFRAIVANDPPDFRTISDFRKIHLAAFRPLFLEVLRVAGEMGMVKLGNLSTDGTKMGANASRHKAMSYGYMNKEIQRLEAEIEQLLKQAEQLDAEQDAALGSRRGDELPDELKRREERLAKIRERVPGTPYLTAWLRFVASSRPVMRYAKEASDIARCSAIGLLPQRASPATVGSEAWGTT